MATLHPSLRQPLGSLRLSDGRCHFLVWAPFADAVQLKVVTPIHRSWPLEPVGDGYYAATVEPLPVDTCYFYRLNDQLDRPDPASRLQPQGVHGPSQLVSLDHPWTDVHWPGIPLADYIIYELHVGTFSPQGNMAGIQDRLDYLQRLGVTAVELMPIAQFPGERNWGYDGAFPFAVQASYGGPKALQQLVDACHDRGLAVVLDVVYNHLGPEGNYLGDFGPYFTDRYRTPWGAAVNFDGPHSDAVRRYFIDNARQWIRDFHIDALRLDAVHAIFDSSARPILQELTAEVHAEADRLNRRVYVIEESNKNDPRHITPVALGGYGLDAVWNDDFHHAVHTLLTGERDGYYVDFGRFDQLVAAWRDGFVYTGQFSQFRQRRHGMPAQHLPPERFVVSIQTHDQIGNRMLGERLGQQVRFEQSKLAAGLMLWSPYIPMLFMGEEYGERAPFLYFVHHGDADVIEGVRLGRKAEFASFAWLGEVPDPQAEETFRRTQLEWGLLDRPEHQALWSFYQTLIRTRKEVPALANRSRHRLRADAYDAWSTLVAIWHDAQQTALTVFCLADRPIRLPLALPPGRWKRLVDSADSLYQGPGSAMAAELGGGAVEMDLAPHSCALWVGELDD